MPSSGVKTCARSEEHTSELQSHDNLVCRLLLEKKNHVRQIVSHPRPDCHAASVTHSDHFRQRASVVYLEEWPVAGFDAGATVALVFFFNDPAPPKISPLPLHDALPF